MLQGRNDFTTTEDVGCGGTLRDHPTREEDLRVLTPDGIRVRVPILMVSFELGLEQGRLYCCF